MNIIEIRDLCFGYEKDSLDLENINMDIKKGSVTTILGGNGAGKSTLFLNLNGVLKPLSGQVKVDGEVLTYDKKSLNQMRRNVGIVFQDPDDQLFSADVYRDISFGAVNLGLPKEEVIKRVNAAMEKTNISHLKDRPAHALSYGQKKRVAIAGVLVMEPKVIILDEPTAGLDPKGVEEITDLLQRLSRDKGITIVIATHDMDLVSTISDYIYILKDGQVTGKGSPSEIFSNPQLLYQNDLGIPILNQLMHKLYEEDSLNVDRGAFLMEDVRNEIKKLISP